MVIRLKICLLGEQGVGKTSLILRFVKDYFPIEYKATLGADFLQKNLDKKDYPDLKDSIELIIWDVAGQTNYIVEKMTDYYLQGSSGYILVFDMTDKTTLKNLEPWNKKILKMCGNIPFVVVGNKNDLLDKIEVDDTTIKSVSKKYRTIFYKTSARNGENINTMFYELTKNILDSN